MVCDENLPVRDVRNNRVVLPCRKSATPTRTKTVRPSFFYFSLHRSRPNCNSTVRLIRASLGVRHTRCQLFSLVVFLSDALGCGVRRHDDALICATRRAVFFPRPRGFATARSTAISLPGLQLGRAEHETNPASQSRSLGTPSLGTVQPAHDD